MDSSPIAPVEANIVLAVVVEPIVVPVAPTLVDKNLEVLFKAITTDAEFLKKVKYSVDKIKKDGKVDQYDVPEIVFVISETINSRASF